MAKFTKHSMVQTQVRGGLVAAGSQSIGAVLVDRLAPASLSPFWLPVAERAGHDPFMDYPDSLGTNPGGSRAGRSESTASHPSRCRGRMSRSLMASTAVRTGVHARQADSDKCRVPAHAG